MKKLILTGLAMVAGAALAQAQGTISINAVANTVVTNGVTTGAAYTGVGSYTYELLDMSQSAYGALTSGQQAGIYSLAANQSDISLWTDSGISGVNGSAAAKGGITGLGGGGGTSAANWGAPTGASYSSSAIDYYTVLGWSASMGTWATVLSELQNGTLTTGAGQFFGQTLTAYNNSGGGPSSLPAVAAFGTSAATGLAGSGLPASIGALQLNAIPEPATLALAGLGGLSMLFLRRRKS
jgi:PEP-CTERM motif